MSGSPIAKKFRRLRARMAAGEEHCRICGVTEGLTLDHLIPRAWLGGHTLGNLTILCEPCNKRKGAGYLDLPSLAEEGYDYFAEGELGVSGNSADGAPLSPERALTLELILPLLGDEPIMHSELVKLIGKDPDVREDRREVRGALKALRRRGLARPAGVEGWVRAESESSVPGGTVTG